MGQISVEPAHEDVCKCGKKITFGYANGDPVGLHAMPPCEDYSKRELLDYMTWLRLSKSN